MSAPIKPPTRSLLAAYLCAEQAVMHLEAFSLPGDDEDHDAEAMRSIMDRMWRRLSDAEHEHLRRRKRVPR